MKSPARPAEPKPTQNPLFEAFGQMIVEAANREANLRAQLIEVQWRLAELSTPIVPAVPIDEAAKP